MLAILAAAAVLATPPSDSVHYSLSPVMRDGALQALAVEIRLAGDADGETRLLLPDEWAGSDSLWQNISGLTVDGATAVREEGGVSRILSHRPGAPLVVRYQVNSPYDEDPGFNYHKGLPVIRPGWFFFNGEGVFATPNGRMESPASFRWTGVPAAWKVASDLDHLSSARPGTVNDIVQTTGIGAPDLAIATHPVGGALLRVAMRGQWEFTAEEFARSAAAIMNAENRMWGAPGRPFLITLGALGGTGSGLSYMGTARGDAFAVASTPGFNLRDAARFLAHEYMHTWFAPALGGSPDHEASGFWFSEGFTEFYAARVLLREGLWTPREYVDHLNSKLLRNASSPVRGATLAQMEAGYWTDGNLQLLPYDRGHLGALVWDARLRAATGGRVGVDEVIAEQYRTAARNGTGAGRVSAPELFVRTVREMAGVDLRDDIARMMERGEPIVLPADAFGACARVDTASQPTFSRGFDARATNAAGGVLAGVDSAGPAFAAGMRNGMRLIRREPGVFGDATVALAYRVADESGERVIRYLPAGTGRVHLQRVTLTAEGETPQCRRLMAGG
ncbi:MAG TPA: hypothetical protein VF665_07345 [Longimicrobium sp.]|jgi:predicted metalloprotease with PDZ domain|uniref:M61 family metallopeptidase n=1 Tax=Longimicrobium sp. TaxID=2029185 RepID=UPI002EDB2399